MPISLGIGLGMGRGGAGVNPPALLLEDDTNGTSVLLLEDDTDFLLE